MVLVESSPRIVIGIDFGTTYSGSAWARSGKPDNITVITNWPSKLRGNFDLHKAPTQIHFGRCEKKSTTWLGANESTPAQGLTWGYNVPIEETPLKWFKLLLIEERDVPESLRDSRQLKEARDLLRKERKTVNEVVAAYLKAFWEHIVANINRAVGKGLFRISTLDVVITLPAIWPHYAQARMRQAATEAGILDEHAAGPTSLSFISEPEAAALATLQDMTNRPDVEVGDHLVVCDAGGGTVDIITYEVMRNEPLSMRESIKGDGKLCGAIFLDEGFIKLVERKIGAAEWARLSSQAQKKFLNDQWEHAIKKEFDTSYDNTWTVHMPSEGATRSGFHNVEFQLTQSEVLSVFQPVATDVEMLVVDQIRQVKAKYNKSPKYVILVGGFGRCQYLYTKLRESSLISILSGDTDILQGSGDQPWTAICRGAVLKGMMMNPDVPHSISVTSRISRASYGVRCHEPFLAGLHDERDKTWSAQEQEWKANSVHWFLEIGTDISETRPVKHGFYQLLKGWENVSSISSTLELSRAARPPSRPDDTVKTLCRVSWQKELDLATFPAWHNSLGEMYRKVSFDIEMISDGASVEFRVLIGKEQLASQNVQVLFE